MHQSLNESTVATLIAIKLDVLLQREKIEQSILVDDK